MDLFRRLRYLFNRRQYDQDLASDMEFHREMAAREGRRFGNALQLREESREVWGWTWMDRLGQDLRYAFRLLKRSPGFTIAAVLMLGLGIGVNVAAFGFFNLVLFKPLPVRDPDSLVRLQRRSLKDYATFLPYPESKFLSDHSKALSSVIATSQALMWIEVGTKPLGVNFVTTNYFKELGVTPAAGRLLNTSYDDGADAEPVAVLSYEFWQRYFGGDPSIVGRTIHLNNKPVSVVGVIGRNFGGLTLSKPDIWIPIKQQPYFINGSRLLTDYSGDGVDVWGRLQPGVTMQAAEQELSQLTAELYTQHPKDLWEKESIHCDPGGLRTYRQWPDEGQRCPHAREGDDPANGRHCGRPCFANPRGGLCQSRQSAAGARSGQAKGDLHSYLRGRRPRPADPSAIHRKSPARGARFSRRIGVGHDRIALDSLHQ